MNSLMVIDNFLPNPIMVRNEALSLDYFDNTESASTFPGKRTKCIAEVNPEYNKSMFGKIAKLIYNIEESSYSIDMRSYFQLVSSNYVRGWVHKDVNADIAGVLYLNENPPLNSGTEFYQQKKDIPETDRLAYYETKKNFVMGSTTYLEAQDVLQKNNDCYELVDVIGNKFNRLILYPGNWFHCAKNYFGDTKENSRLTQVFFISCLSHNSDYKYFLDKVKMDK